MTDPIYMLGWLWTADSSSSRSAGSLELQPNVLYFIHRLAIEVEVGFKDLIDRTGMVFGIQGPKDEDEDE
jgi:hypothetical protein